MTCIVGIKKGNHVIVGGDSAGSNCENVIIRKDEKVFKIDDFIFGATTSFRMIQLIRYSFKPPVIKSKIGFHAEQGEIDLHEYMCTTFVDALRKCFKNGGFLTSDNGAEIGGSFIVGVKDKLFTIHNDFQVSESLETYTSVGAGYRYALPAMKALSENTDLSPEEVALKALEISAFYCPSVRAPFNFVST